MKYSENPQIAIRINWKGWQDEYMKTNLISVGYPKQLQGLIFKKAKAVSLLRSIKLCWRI